MGERVANRRWARSRRPGPPPAPRRARRGTRPRPSDSTPRAARRRSRARSPRPPAATRWPGGLSRASRRAITCLTPSGRPTRWSSPAPASLTRTPASARWRTISSRNNGLPSVSSCSARVSARDGASPVRIRTSSAVSRSLRPPISSCGDSRSRRRSASVSREPSRGRLGRPVGAEDQQPGRIGGAGQVAQQQQRRPVGPVQIVEHEQHRRARRDRRQQPDDGLEQPVALGLGLGRRAAAAARAPGGAARASAGRARSHTRARSLAARQRAR